MFRIWAMPFRRSLVVDVFHPASVRYRPVSRLSAILFPCKKTALPSVIVLPMDFFEPLKKAFAISCVTFLIFILSYGF